MNAKDVIILTECSYIVGIDIRPGRYSVKLVSGEFGNLRVSGKDPSYGWYGEKEGANRYRENVRLTRGSKIDIIGDIKLLFERQDSYNMNEDVSIIEQQREEIEDLKNELSKLRKELQSLKVRGNEEKLPEKYVLSKGFYYGGETIKTGVYDIEWVSGDGYVKIKGIPYRLGEYAYSSKKLNGIKITPKTKIEMSGDLIANAKRININNLT